MHNGTFLYDNETEGLPAKTNDLLSFLKKIVWQETIEILTSLNIPKISALKTTAENTKNTLHACVRACVCAVSVIVKHPALPPYVVDGSSRNPLY